jgi:plastocyanin
VVMGLVRSRALVALLLLTFTALAAGCGSNSSSAASSSPAANPVAVSAASSAASSAPAANPVAASAPASGHVSVSIRGYAFHPARITVTPGTKITFSNHDQQPHTATSTNSSAFDKTVIAGASATVRLTKPGTYTYYCQFHAFMHGTLVVK